MGKISEKHKPDIREYLLLLSGTIIIITLFITSPQLREGILIAKEHWFRWATVFFCLTSFFVLLSDKKRIIPTFKPTDAVVSISIAWIVITYDFKSNPDPERISWIILLGILWFFLRTVFTRYTKLMDLFIYILVISSLLESLLGLAQLYGLADSYHGKSRISGSFFNPGPYAGYIALFFPLALNNFLEQYKKNKTEHSPKITVWIYASTLLAAILVLPATLSRSAWIAALLPSLAITAYHLRWIDYWKQWQNRKYIRAILLIIISLGIAAGGTGIYLMKKDSADGRLFIWKQCSRIIEQNPLTGVGSGGFAPAYGNIQAAYFASGETSPQEEKMAECPQYAFNEYLQIAVETGFPGLLLFLSLLLLSLYNCIKDKKWGIAGSFVAFMLFALSSYPLSLIPFPVALIFLTAIAQTPREENGNKTYPRIKEVLYLSFLCMLLIIAAGITITQKDSYGNYKQWYAIRAFYQAANYEQAAHEYGALFPDFQYQPAFIYEYAYSLSQTGEYIESNKLLEHLAQISCNPLIFNRKGLNHQAMGEYEKAEENFRHALNLIPSRLYPYYLLAKLYAEPDFYNPGKMNEMAQIVLTKKAKVDSKAIQEMRDEMKKLLDEHSQPTH